VILIPVHEVAVPTDAAQPKPKEQAGGCLTRQLIADIYCCVARKSGCDHALSFGYEYFCQHLDRAAFSLENDAAAHPAGTQVKNPAADHPERET